MWDVSLKLRVLCFSAQVKNILKRGGGMREFYLNELVTHIITESPPDPATLPISDVTVVKVGLVNLYAHV